MTKQRIFALFFAILFLLSSSSLVIALIVSKVESNDNSSSGNSSTSKTTSSNLAGTKLAGFTPTANITTLEISDIKVGSGSAVKPGDTVRVTYTGAVAATGIIFNSSGSQPVSLSLSSVIEGWAEGIPGMKVGGTRELLIPSNLAYGANPPSGSNIPPNAGLVFIVTLHSFSSS